MRGASSARRAGVALLVVAFACLHRTAAAQATQGTQEARALVLRAEPEPGHEGEVDPDLLARAEGATIAALVTLSRTPLRDERTDAQPPADDAALAALAAGRRADWVVRLRVLPTQAGYVAHADAFFVAGGGVALHREGTAEIVREQEVSQLVALLEPLLERPAVPEPATPADGAPSTPPAGAPATSEAEAAAQWQEREEARQEAARNEAWEGRERYGVPERFLLQGGLALRPLAGDPGAGGDRVMGALELRFGLGFPEVKGLEWRGSLEAVFGAISGLSLMTGAVYLFSPFVDAPVHLGPGLEIGFLQSLEEELRQAFFAFRLSGVASWRFHGAWYLEGALPEIMVLRGGGATGVTVGLAARVGRRF